MKLRILSILLVAGLSLGLYSTGLAQSSKPSTQNNPQSDRGFVHNFQWVSSNRADLHEMNFIGGYSFHSSKGFWGKIPGATLKMFSLRYNRKLLIYNDKHILEYVTELNMAADYTLTTTPRYRAGKYTGLGVTPVGFQFNWRANNIVQPFFKTSAGFMYFSKPFPDTRGSKFNFTLEFGAGLEFLIARNLSFSIGYKYHHMSNGQLGQINPGVDSNVFYSGFTLF